jgi:NAD(P)-dependent dehydrogenase (short-subunit alcohol dehydrogenase family)
MTVTLITGGNKGLGFETARQLISAGHQVWIGARNPDRGQQAAGQLGARFVPLDVTDDASAAAAADRVGELDVLVNNAGIAGERTDAADTTAGTCGGSMRRTCSGRCACCTPSCRCCRSPPSPWW